jgi:hypothetical protein
MNSQDSFRIDKNIAHNIDYISKYSNDKNLVNSDSGLVKNLIYYFCHSYQNNLFNYGTLDVVDFSNKFGYSEHYLKGRHPEPEQFKGKTEVEIEQLYKRQDEDLNFKIYDSIIENALFILHTKPIVFARGAKTVDYKNNEITYTSDSNSYLIVQQLSIKTVSNILKENQANKKLRGNQGAKVVYQYALDRSFIENLSHYYLKGVRESLIQLRKSSLDDLYLYLSNLKNTLAIKSKNQTTREETPGFELLCRIANIKSVKENGEPYDNKYRKRDLIKCLKEINKKSELKFEFRWIKNPEDRWSYIPIFIFEAQKVDLIEEKKSVFRTRLSHELLEAFRICKGAEYFSDNRDGLFLKWLKDSTANEKEKKLAYETAHFKTQGKISQFIDSMKDSFFQKLPVINSLNDIQ